MVDTLHCTFIASWSYNLPHQCGMSTGYLHFSEICILLEKFVSIPYNIRGINLLWDDRLLLEEVSLALKRETFPANHRIQCRLAFDCSGRLKNIWFLPCGYCRGQDILTDLSRSWRWHSFCSQASLNPFRCFGISSLLWHSSPWML